ncbi:MAG: N,N-dimethylformamidase beta subunit family domain-containing protein, partial [Acidimicrobiales bacterium]
MTPAAPERRHARRRRRRTRQLRALVILAAAAALVVGLVVSLTGGVGPHAHTAGRASRHGHSHPPIHVHSELAGTNGPDGVTAGWVIRENHKHGTGEWQLKHPATNGQIAGYANTVSIDEGGAADLYVSTTSPTYQVVAYRMGWYGGAEGRQIWASGRVPGRVQPTCPVVVPTNTVECHWADPLRVQTTVAGWPQGDYLFKLTAASGYQSYIPLTIRDDASHSVYLIQNDVTTWQAYNTYGGYSLYQGPAGPGQSTLANRARIVSFDRPYAFDNGAADFLGLELKLVALAESRGLDVSYTTDVDVYKRPSLLLDHRVFISLGHDEYWSRTQRDAVVAARDHGVNLFFMGANAIYRPIRFESSP